MSAAGSSGETGQTGCSDRSDRSSGRHPEPTGQSNRSDQSDADWLVERIDHYLSRMNNIYEAIEDTEDMDKLGQGLRQLIL